MARLTIGVTLAALLPVNAQMSVRPAENHWWVVPTVVATLSAVLVIGALVMRKAGFAKGVTRGSSASSDTYVSRWALALFVFSIAQAPTPAGLLGLGATGAVMFTASRVKKVRLLASLAMAIAFLEAIICLNVGFFFFFYQQLHEEQFAVFDTSLATCDPGCVACAIGNNCFRFESDWYWRQPLRDAGLITLAIGIPLPILVFIAAYGLLRTLPDEGAGDDTVGPLCKGCCGASEEAMAQLSPKPARATEASAKSTSSLLVSAETNNAAVTVERWAIALLIVSVLGLLGLPLAGLFGLLATIPIYCAFTTPGGGAALAKGRWIHAMAVTAIVFALIQVIIVSVLLANSQPILVEQLGFGMDPHTAFVFFNFNARYENVTLCRKTQKNTSL